jgi:hypothetical protein
MPKLFTRVCDHCAMAYQGPSPRYCSRKCYVASKRIDRTCQACSKVFQARRIYVDRGQMRYCSTSCGQFSSRLREGVDVDGRRFVVNANGYYVSSDGKDVKLHRYVWEKAHGKIPDGFVVHHKNEKKLDNRLENLEMMAWSEHTAEHSRERWKLGKPIGKSPAGGCSTSGCDRVSKAKGLCTRHYQQAKAKERGRWL